MITLGILKSPVSNKAGRRGERYKPENHMKGIETYKYLRRWLEKGEEWSQRG
jgi:hypothetical protein